MFAENAVLARLRLHKCASSGAGKSTLMNPAWLHNNVVQWLLTVGGIILVDVSLSGDNALVIGAVASRLPSKQRAIALIWGGVAAAALRIILTALASELLLIPLVQSIGAVVIFYIAITMLIPEKDDARAGRRVSDRLVSAIVAIFVADVTMSVDNVLAIGALARGNLPVLIFGLVVSVALLLLASALIARIIERFWWLMDLTALLLAYLAAQLVLSDPIVSRMAGLTSWKATALTVGAIAIVFVIAIALRVSRTRARKRQAGTSDMERQSDDEAVS